MAVSLGESGHNLRLVSRAVELLFSQWVRSNTCLNVQRALAAPLGGVAASTLLTVARHAGVTLCPIMHTMFAAKVHSGFRSKVHRAARR